MAENVCVYCDDIFRTSTGKVPDPPMCDDCMIARIWGVRLDDDPDPKPAVKASNRIKKAA